MSDLQCGNHNVFALLHQTQMEIEKHYSWESEKIIIQARTDAACLSEKTRIFHHNLLVKNHKKSSILKLNTKTGILIGHEQCMEYLESEVFNLLSNVHIPNPSNENDLLNEIVPSFTPEDNKMLLAPPEESEIKNIISESNLSAAPGLDGISTMFYNKCWDIIKSPFVKMIKSVHEGKKPTSSQHTSLMTFCHKPKKAK